MSQEFNKSASELNEENEMNFDQDNENLNEIANTINANKEELFSKYDDTDLSKLNEENLISSKQQKQGFYKEKNQDRFKSNAHNYEVESVISSFKKSNISDNNQRPNRVTNDNYEYYNSKISKLEKEYSNNFANDKNNFKFPEKINSNDDYEEADSYMKNISNPSANPNSNKPSYVSKNYNYNYNNNNVSPNQSQSKQEFSGMNYNNNPNAVSAVNYQNNANNQIQNTSKSLNEDSNKLLMQVMEKDKIIFEYSQLLKETERMLDKNKKLNSDKDHQINKLKDEIKELKFTIKNTDNLLAKKEEELDKYKNHTEDKFMSINREKALFEEKYNDLAKLFENNHSDFQNTVFEYKKMENNLERLKQQLFEKEETIRDKEKFIEELKREIKNIPNLKKEIYDLEMQLKSINKELQDERKINNKIIQNTNEAEKKLGVIIEESKQGKEFMNNCIKLNFELENLKKEIEFKDQEIDSCNEKYKALMKENDNFVHYFTKEITDFTCLMENINYNCNIKGASNMPMNPSNINNLNYQSGFDKFSLKFEILNKNFEALKKKYVENYNQNLMTINKFEKSLGDLEKINKEIINERDAVIKEASILKQNIKDLNSRFEDLNEENEKLNDNYRNIRDNYIKLKNEYEDLQVKNQNLCQETHLFLMNCNEKLKEKFPEINSLNANSSNQNKNNKKNIDNQIYSNESNKYFIFILNFFKFYFILL